MSKDASLQKAGVETYTINTVLGKDDVSLVHVLCIVFGASTNHAITVPFSGKHLRLQNFAVNPHCVQIHATT